MAEDRVHAGFVRYRRFLIAISIALACLDVLGLKINQLTLLGNTAPIAHPERVAMLAWIVWAWALLQYLVWFHDVEAWRDFKQAIVKDCETRLGNRLAGEAIPMWLKGQLRAEFASRHASPDRLENIRYVTAYSAVHGDGIRRERAADILATAYIRLPDHKGEDQTSQVRFEREILTKEWRNQYIISLLRILITSRFIPEYFAPFAIAFVPVAVRFWSHVWPR
ncbi:MAG TPA: hypothetical protein VN660_02105 [Steroidobacteraceae bacterium]|nr:hypothetical protein [Steroidobacteraceae bacterium]